MAVGYRVATVFGGSGFIGRHVIRRLAKDGTVIKVPTRQPERVKPLMVNGAVGQIVAVPFDGSSQGLMAAMAGSDVVINLIGILAESGSARFQAVQADLPGRIAGAATAAHVAKLVHLSALGVGTSSRSAYARSKASGEGAVRRFFPDAVILRPGVVFGPEDHFFNLFANLARFSPVLPLIGGGTTRFQPVYVGDVAAAIMAALEMPEAAGNTYELGGPSVYTFRQIMEMVLLATHRRRLLLPMPWALATLPAAVLEHLPGRLLTRDQLQMLRVDNVVSGTAFTLQNLGIVPTAAEVVLPNILERFRRGGHYTRVAKLT